LGARTCKLERSYLRDELFVVQNTNSRATCRFGVVFGEGKDDRGVGVYYVAVPRHSDCYRVRRTRWRKRGVVRRDDMDVRSLGVDVGRLIEVAEGRKKITYVRHKRLGYIGTTRSWHKEPIPSGHLYCRTPQGERKRAPKTCFEEITQKEYEAVVSAVIRPKGKARKFRKCVDCGRPINPDPMVDGGWLRCKACIKARREAVSEIDLDMAETGHKWSSNAKKGYTGGDNVY